MVFVVALVALVVAAVLVVSHPKQQPARRVPRRRKGFPLS